jgi:hypothetical protein
MPRPPRRLAQIYGTHGQHAYHYTTSDATFEQILPSGELRLSSLARLRDPVENKDWVQALWTSAAWPTADVERFQELTRRVLYETKILSFTLDAPTVAESPEHARGYARPRMWEQYAENHAGACLVFDRELLAESLLPALSVFNDTIADEVVYSDVPLPGHEGARSLVAAALTQAGDGDLERGLRRHLHEHARELFFRKLTDWVTEREYRYLILDNNPLDVSAHYRDALQAVIVGERFPQWQIPGAALVCSAADATLRQMQWGASPPGVFDPTVSETQS